MKELYLNAYAKINLTLDVLRKREDGYHDLETILHTLSLHDGITLREASRGVTVICNDASVPTDTRNLVYRAASLLQKTFGVERGVEIEITKHIPIASGLGGGSSDAAVTLLGLIQMWKLRVDRRFLIDLALRIGSDVPFFLVGGAAIVRGRGEQVDPLPPLPPTWVVLAKPPLEISTAWAYSHLDLTAIKRRPDTPAMQEALRAKDLLRVARLLCNVFEELVIPEYPLVGEIKERMVRLGAYGAAMTGTGPVVYGLAPDEETARRIATELASSLEVQVDVTKTFAEQR
ncbi:MAG: 4-(cytidine 5'-diphospho)-2-C-methyl-D-erythritol kinase [Armatimonadota bacterium]|nr:4-(cytidine 5'-diphospho)-2-C-methyl-D-erythritol kinase [Armatimonadota bacterium]